MTAKAAEAARKKWAGWQPVSTTNFVDAGGEALATECFRHPGGLGMLWFVSDDDYKAPKEPMGLAPFPQIVMKAHLGNRVTLPWGAGAFTELVKARAVEAGRYGLTACGVEVFPKSFAFTCTDGRRLHHLAADTGDVEVSFHVDAASLAMCIDAAEKYAKASGVSREITVSLQRLSQGIGAEVEGFGEKLALVIASGFMVAVLWELDTAWPKWRDVMPKYKAPSSFPLPPVEVWKRHREITGVETQAVRIAFEPEGVRLKSKATTPVETTAETFLQASGTEWGQYTPSTGVAGVDPVYVLQALQFMEEAGFGVLPQLQYEILPEEEIAGRQLLERIAEDGFLVRRVGHSFAFVMPIDL